MGKVDPVLFSSIRSRLFAAVLATTIPTVLALGLLAWLLYSNQKKQVEIDILQTSRALTAAVDRDFRIGLNVAQALAGSKHLQQGDLAGFHTRARAMLTESFPGFTFVLSDASGQQLLNALRPFGAPLPRHGNPEQLLKVFETGKPLISPLYIGGVTRLPVASIDVPVWRGDKVVWVLSVGIQSQSLNRLLAEQGLPPGRMAAVFDPTGTIAARTHKADEFVGRKGVPELLARMLIEPEGIVETRTLEGLDVIIAYSRSKETGWSVGISTPWTVVLSETLRQIALVYVSVALLLVIGIATAWVIGGKISKSVSALTKSAMALGSGDPITVLKNGPREAIEVSRTLKAVEQELHLYRDHLERLVSERTEALQASNAELEQFAYVASHDLQEPLRMVVSYVDLLSRRYGDQLGQDGHEFIGYAREGALRMSELIKDLLDYSRIGRHNEVPTRVDLASVVEEVLADLHLALADSRGSVVIATPLPAIVGSRVELVRLFLNLLGNSLKYCRVGIPPEVRIAAREEGGETVIEVADNGIGIEPQYREQIFGLFQRLHGRHDYPGTGIGLASAKKIVERHHGRIWVEAAPHGGSLFRFTLPGMTVQTGSASPSDIPSPG